MKPETKELYCVRCQQVRTALPTRIGKWIEFFCGVCKSRLSREDSSLPPNINQ